MAFHAPTAPDPCTTSPAPGTACADGQTVYAGSWNGSRYYTTMTDQSTAAYWGAYNVNLYSLEGETNGLDNTNRTLAAIEANPQAGACNAFPYNPPACSPNAFVLCKNLRTTLGGDWYLPAKDEFLNVLYENRSAVGMVPDVWYWTSTAFGSGGAARRYQNDYLSTHTTNFAYRVRCVRR